MILLITGMIISIYWGLAVSVIFRLNQNHVLDNRAYLALLIPIYHFIVWPIRILLDFNCEMPFVTRMKFIGFMTVMFPVILSQYAVALKSIEVIKEEKDVKKYQEVCQSEFKNMAFV